MPQHDWCWHTITGPDPQNNLIILTEDYQEGRVRLEIRQAGARSISHDQVEELVENALLSLQEALRSPKRLQRRPPG
jgi:hypothetical protein